MKTQFASTNKTTKLAVLAVMGLAIATSVLPRAARAQSAAATVDNIDDGDVSDWKPFAGNGATMSHRTSSSRATTGTLSMKLMYAVTQGGYAGAEKMFPTPPNWSAANALTMSVNGLGTGHKFRIQVYDAGNERWEYSFTVGFNGWQQVTIPFGSFTRASYQVPGAQANSVFDRGAIKGMALIPSSGPGTGAVYVDSLEVNGATSPSTPTAPAPTPPAATPAGTIIPLYSYPLPGAWDAVIAAKRAHPKVPVLAVVNPNTEPGAAPNSSYMSGIAQLINAGIKVIGYVPTTYGQRAPADIQAEIKRWKSLYPSVTGIFLDEMLNKPGKESYYKSLTDYAKTHGFDFVIGNPGADSVPSYVGTVDVMLVYESAGFPTAERMGGWHTSYDKRNFGIIPHSVPYMSRSFVASARQYAGYIYLQNDTMPDPWDTVPPFLLDLMAALAA
jgi:hypothetical protein